MENLVGDRFLKGSRYLPCFVLNCIQGRVLFGACKGDMGRFLSMTWLGKKSRLFNVNQQIYAGAQRHGRKNVTTGVVVTFSRLVGINRVVSRVKFGCSVLHEPAHSSHSA